MIRPVGLRTTGWTVAAAILTMTAATAAPMAAKAPETGCIAGDTVAMDPATQPEPLGTQSYPRTLKLCDHRVVLTFDDGPSPLTTPQIPTPCARPA